MAPKNEIPTNTAMTVADLPPRTLEIVYRPAADGGWTGACPTFPDIQASGSSIHQVDLTLAPMLTQAIGDRHGPGLMVSVMPGGDEPLDGERRRKFVPVNAAYMPCAMQPGGF